MEYFPSPEPDRAPEPRDQESPGQPFDIDDYFRKELSLADQISDLEQRDRAYHGVAITASSIDFELAMTTAQRIKSPLLRANTFSHLIGSFTHEPTPDQDQIASVVELALEAIEQIDPAEADERAWAYVDIGQALTTWTKLLDPTSVIEQALIAADKIKRPKLTRRQRSGSETNWDMQRLETLYKKINSIAYMADLEIVPAPTPANKQTNYEIKPAAPKPPNVALRLPNAVVNLNPDRIPPESPEKPEH